MSAKGFICLLLMIFIPVMGAFPALAGHGPRSAVYGTATTFVGYRAFLALVTAVAVLMSAVALFLTYVEPPTFEFLSLLRMRTASFPYSLLSDLRC